MAVADFIGKSSKVLRVLELVEQIAKKDVRVFIRGETGTGKTVIARRIHDLSPRKYGPFERIDPEQTPDSLFMAGLLGWEKGTFTGATESKKGKLEQVSGGTLLIDNINLLKLSFQIGLLRVLEDGAYEQIGKEKLQKSDFRLICTANESLKDMVDSGRFRGDLYHRIDGFKIDLPPLRQRENDILILSDHYLKHF